MLRDERGKTSMARTLLVVEVIHVLAMGVLGAVGAVWLSPSWWAFQGPVTIALVAWAAGPRGLQYLGPQLGNVARGIAAAASRHTRTDNRFRDSERGPPPDAGP